MLIFRLGIRRCGCSLHFFIFINKQLYYEQILSCAWQRENPIQLWDYGSGKLLASLEPDSYPSLLYCGKYVSNMFIACGGTDTNLFRVIDLRSHAVNTDFSYGFRSLAVHSRNGRNDIVKS